MTNNELFHLLTESTFFNKLDESAIMKVLASVHYQVKEYVKDDVIAIKGEACEWFQMVIEGSVRGEMTDAEGKVLKIENVSKGSSIALAFLFGRNSRYPVTVIANEKSRIFRIEKKDVIKMLQANTIILENMLILVSEKAQFLSGRIHFLTLKTIREKLAEYIIIRLKPNTVSIVLDRTQSELAEFFGVTRPSLARAIKQLEDDGFLEVKGKTIKIVDLLQFKQI